jgi:hypothetical protein
MTSVNLRPEIFWHLTENRPFFWISPENRPFSGFFSDTKICTFIEMLFLEQASKIKSISLDFTLISAIIHIIFFLFPFFLFRAFQKFVSELA